ncbi:hypothetical protein [Nocardia terpenica]|uniref:Carotenoid biosynthesis protein n=1 Tax=Nocardia terpenica TaxID=455432 RepID=A0A164PTF3_9NOCA|nr:hypothetical protein [Nocardia terpenica]KZM76041.1 hypothetical protein AWN90_17240 [Nocardia terpenica]NQE85594.1 hypothetical protein [Nocardia terpenica]
MSQIASAGALLDPPVDTVAHYPLVTLICALVFVVVSAVVGIGYTLLTRSPLYFWTAVAGATLYPFLVEPLGDHLIAVWYPSNHYIAATVFDRPMPWFVVLFYLAGIPLVSVAAWEIVRRGLPARVLIGLLIAVTILEIPIEMIANRLGWMRYYGNHATIVDVPIYCLVQNAGMFAVVAWVLAWLLPRTHGWRWLLVPFAVAATLPALALAGTFPAYIAIATHAGPALGWAAGLFSTILNATIVTACVYSPPLQRFRSTTVPSPAEALGPAVSKPAEIE